MPRLSPRILTVGAALALSLPLLVRAQGAFPQVRPGLWESKADIGGMNIKSQICIGAETLADAVSRAQGGAPGAARACSPPSITPIPGGFHVEHECNRDGRVTKSSGNVTGDFNSHYNFDMTVSSGGRPPRRMVMDQIRLGDCPAGMKPGEARLDQGAIAAAIAAARAGRGQ